MHGIRVVSAGCRTRRLPPPVSGEARQASRAGPVDDLVDKDPWTRNTGIGMLGRPSVEALFDRADLCIAAIPTACRVSVHDRHGETVPISVPHADPGTHPDEVQGSCAGFPGCFPQSDIQFAGACSARGRAPMKLSATRVSNSGPDIDASSA